MSTIRALLERRSAAWIVLGIALVLGLLTIPIGFYNDDYVVRAALEGTWPGAPAPWDLYRFSYGGLEANRGAIAGGELPWWTTPWLRLHLLRPLGSLSFVLDEKVFGASSAVGWHLHSIAWYLILVFVVGVVLRSVLPRATATLGMLVYAMSPAHLFPYGWISARHMTMSATLGLLGLAALIRDRGGVRGRWLFALGLAGALAAGETGIGVAVFGIVWVIAHSKRREIFTRLAPAALVLVIWVAAYTLLEGGAAHSDGYVDPLSAPRRFAVKAAAMVPVLFGNAIFGVPAEMASIGSPGPLAVGGFIAAIFVAAMWRAARPSMHDDERSALPWLVTAAVLAVVPSAGGFPGARVLLVPNLGFAALVAVLVLRGPRVGAGLLVLVHVAAAPLVDAGNAVFNARVGRKLEAASATVDVGTDPKARLRMFVLGGSDPLVTMYPPIVLLATSPEHRERMACWSIVSGSKQAHTLTRTSANEILVRAHDGPILRGPFESLYRSSTEPLRENDAITQCGAVYRVAAFERDLPREIRVTFDVPLDDPTIRLLVWNGERFTTVAPPRVGETLEVPWSAGPLGMF